MKRTPFNQRIYDRLATLARDSPPALRLRITRMQDAFDFYESFGGETDRGCALIAASYLDNKLVNLLQSFLLDERTARKLLSDSRGALGTFSARIDLCYALGLIGPLAHRELHLLRRIRNDFAHTAEPLHFDNEAVVARVHELHAYHVFPEAYPRTTFLRSTSGLLSFLLQAIPKEHVRIQRDLTDDYVRPSQPNDKSEATTKALVQ